MSADLDDLIRSGMEKTKKHKDRSTKKKKEKRTEDDGASHRKSEKKKRKREEDEALSGQLTPSKRHRAEIVPIVQSPEASTIPSTSLANSPFQLQTTSFYLPLSPVSSLHPLEGICAEHLSPLLLNYYPPFRGVLLSYSNAFLSEHPSDLTKHAGPVLARSIDEYGGSFTWVTADFLIFRPRRGEWIEGYVNLQNEGHLGLVCYNLFNASIERRRLPTEWTWTEPGGHMVNGDDGGEQVASIEEQAEDRGEGFFRNEMGGKIEGTIKFRVKDVDTSFDGDVGFLSIEGTMLDEDGERLFEEEQRPRESGSVSSRASSRGRVDLNQR
ncbi:MAG: hypothetical protein M1817_000216 [Caeruleum heppii]|nr:MAG: hypothetical protein M1817_000216 [Caeruleum heppii]